jgi:hypothetical protein
MRVLSIEPGSDYLILCLIFGDRLGDLLPSHIASHSRDDILFREGDLTLRPLWPSRPPVDSTRRTDTKAFNHVLLVLVVGVVYVLSRT